MEKDLKLRQDLKDWCRDAATRHQYDTAIYIADKLLAITGASNRERITQDPHVT